MISAIDRLRSQVRESGYLDRFLPADEPDAADVLTGIVAGIAGGLVASWVMNQVHGLASKGIERATEAVRGESASDAGGEGESDSEEPNLDDDATVKTAKAVSRHVFRHELTRSEKQVAGPAVHYGYGAAMGGLYGGLAEAVPQVAAGMGTAYGAALWVGEDEIAVPLLGLAGRPTETSPKAHADALVAHLVYGFMTDVVRRLVRAAV